jgi:squalene-hopene/tetraprenyl-beta-curcumene cyclase
MRSPEGLEAAGRRRKEWPAQEFLVTMGARRDSAQSGSKQESTMRVPAWFKPTAACLGTLLASAPAFAAPPAPVKVTRSAPDEPFAKDYSPARSAAFLDAMGVSWTRQHHCGSCHSNYPYLMARPALKGGDPAPLREVRKFFEDRAAHWDTAKPRWPAEVVATAATLAINDARTTGKLHPLTRQALDRMWTLQRPDGTWNWLKCNWAPFEFDDYYGAVFAAVGVGYAGKDYPSTAPARAGLEKLRGYLHKTAAPALHHKVWLLWASRRAEGLMSEADRQATIKELRALQRPDGGWNLPSLGPWKRRNGKPNDPKAPSDGYATGLVVFALREAGVPAQDPQLRRAVAWLKANQRISGRWFTRSLNDDHDHYIAHAGTAFAVLALEACREEVPTQARR